MIKHPRHSHPRAEIMSCRSTSIAIEQRTSPLSLRILGLADPQLTGYLFQLSRLTVYPFS